MYKNVWEARSITIQPNLKNEHMSQNTFQYHYLNIFLSDAKTLNCLVAFISLNNLMCINSRKNFTHDLIVYLCVHFRIVQKNEKQKNVHEWETFREAANLENKSHPDSHL
jgi:hypothetical protein